MPATELYRIFARSLPQTAVLIFDHDCRYLVAEGPEVGAFAGHSPEEIEGRGLDDVFAPHIAGLLLDYHRAALDGGDAGLELSLPGGEYRLRFVPILDDEAGRVDSGLLVAQNITEIRFAQAELGQRIAQLTILHEVESELDDKLDDDYVLSLALDAALRLSEAEAGYIAVLENDELRLERVVGPYPTAALKAALRARAGAIGRALESRQAEWIVDVAADPQHTPLLPRVVSRIVIPLMSQEHVIGVLNLETLRPGVFHAAGFEFIKLMTGRIAVALDNARLYRKTAGQLAELQTLYTRVSKLEQLKTDMIRVAAHDLRNPLAAVMGYLELLTGYLKKQGDTHALGYLDEANKNAARMRKIMTDILSMERIEAAAANNKWELCDVRQLVQDVFDEELFAARARHQKFTLDAPVPPLVIAGDGAQLRQAIKNLTNNAIKYTPDGGTITVYLWLEPKRIVFEVVDNGYGIKEDQQARLFEPFFRARSTETMDIEGTGLGLHLVKNIVERHGGTMRFKSVYQQGSTFGFELPTLDNHG